MAAEVIVSTDTASLMAEAARRELSDMARGADYLRDLLRRVHAAVDDHPVTSLWDEVHAAIANGEEAHEHE
jgi:hypothetical protein